MTPPLQQQSAPPRTTTFRCCRVYRLIEIYCNCEYIKGGKRRDSHNCDCPVQQSGQQLSSDDTQLDHSCHSCCCCCCNSLSSTSSHCQLPQCARCCQQSHTCQRQQHQQLTSCHCTESSLATPICHCRSSDGLTLRCSLNATTNWCQHQLTHRHRHTGPKKEQDEDQQQKHVLHDPLTYLECSNRNCRPATGHCSAVHMDQSSCMAACRLCSNSDSDWRRCAVGSTGRHRNNSTVTCWRTVLLSVLLLLLGVHEGGLCRAEVLYGRRQAGRHDNITSSVQPPAAQQQQQPFTVNSYSDAMRYLQKYGYLHCVSGPRLRRSAVDDNMSVHEGSSSPVQLQVEEGGNGSEQPMNCDVSQVREALAVLQTALRLRPTGRLDGNTRQAMSTGRCGNDDRRVVESVQRLDNDEVEHEGRRQRAGRVARHAAGPASIRQHRIRHHNQHHYQQQQQQQHNRRRIAAVQQPTAATEPRGNEATAEQHRGVAAPKSRQRNATTFPNVATKQLQAFVPGLVVELVPSELDETRRRLEMLSEIKRRLLQSEMDNPTVQRSSLRERSLSRDISRLSAAARRVRRRRRSLRAVVSIDQVFEGPVGRNTRFQKERPVRWRLLDDGVSNKMPLIEQKALLELSFRMWSEVTPIKFVEDRFDSVNDIDILIAFGKQQHLNCDKPFDGMGGELAHSWAAGDIHFDDDENYRRDTDISPNGISLQKLAVHEVGHVLGLLHNDMQHSIMYPIYVTPSSHEDFELVREDRQAVQQIYGVCKGTFDIAFDWLRKSVVPAEPTSVTGASSTRSIYIYNTYFFRGLRYWMYENKYNRTRYGDPLYIEREWTGLPGSLNAFTQVIARVGTDYNIDTYFFKGELYYRYDDEADRVAAGFPRKISDDFGARADSDESIPNNVDAVWFDNNDAMLYFFKDEWVWVYDPRDIGRNNCCSHKHSFSELFPMVDSSAAALTGHVDTVYYSYHYRSVYLFSGEDVYVLVSKDHMTDGADADVSGEVADRWWAGLRRLAPWYSIWYDICDVE